MHHKVDVSRVLANDGRLLIRSSKSLLLHSTNKENLDMAPSPKYLFYRPWNRKSTTEPPSPDRILQMKHSAKFRCRPPRIAPNIDAVRDNVLAEL
ncbi:hypothetical protein ALC57_16026 [Trachymyrmex cornetzi]|uniref:Uncharacterized protein n=1 Tax=Trachymyrmex cornetzi TaxID=471704 RepID=A0A195DHF0_9HYME|nr:hypothetical protein ALC57_16026 [Trachymyrmex cornetzi]